MRVVRASLSVIVALLALTAIFLLAAKTDAASESGTSRTPGQLPDLYIESFYVSTPTLSLHEPVTFTIRACNRAGGVQVGGRRIYLYIDPVDRPPLTTTMDTARWIVGVVWPPGTCQDMAYANYTFGQSGQHIAYAWVDPLELIEETDEVNNMAVVTLTVDPEIPPPDQDSYEPNDACLDAFAVPTDGSYQVHKFAPVGDVDWAKFYATAGEVYTITAVGTGEYAHPIFELWQTCDMPPTDFGGTTFRLVWIAPTEGWYYLRLNNDLSSYPPGQSVYRLQIQSGAAMSGVQPNVMGIDPPWGYNDRNTHVVITGTDFVDPPRASLCSFAEGVCGACTYALGNLSWPNSQRIYAVIPANLPQGDYCVLVINPGGKADILSDAFTIYPGRPEPREVVPVQGYVGYAGDLNLYGFNFHKGISVTVGGVGLENVVVVNQTNLRATVPPSLTPGVYTLTAFYQSSAPGILAGAFTVLPAEQDLFVREQELWVDPVVPQVGQTVEVGVLVYRQGGDRVIFNLPVRFYVDGVLLGNTEVPMLLPDDEQSTHRLQWTPDQPGDYQVSAVVDPCGLIAESSEVNNAVTRTVAVITATGEVEPPIVYSVLIKSSPFTTTGQSAVTDTLVFLDIEATDFPQPGSSGISHIRYIEFEYNQVAQIWIPVQDSGWVISDTVNANNYRLRLTPAGGLHYIQAWARDAVGNISRNPVQASVDYMPVTEHVAHGQSRLYRRTLVAGERLRVILTPQTGDPDLYVWPPDWTSGQSAWGSNNPGTVVEDLTFTATVSGVYQIEVYGYSPSHYQLEIGAAVKGANVSPTAIRGDKPWPQSPAIDPSDQPPLDVPPREPFRQYIPLLIRKSP